MREEMPFHLPRRIKPYIEEAMQVYAKQVAEQTLKDAAENAQVDQIGSNTPFVSKDSILSTPIVTP